MAAEIPQDLITEMLLILPAKTLLRLRCLSKSLLVTIDSPDFIKAHVAKLSDNKNHRKIIVREHINLLPQCNHINLVPLHVFNIDDPLLMELPEGKSNHLYDGNDSWKNYVVANCNGLVVLEEDPFSLVLWNPTTRKSRKLPVLPKQSDWHEVHRIMGVCFGYDSSIEDYKVMVVKERMAFAANYSYYGSNYDETKYEMWILRLRSCHWRWIEVPEDCYFPFPTFKNCFVDGAFHLCYGFGGIFSFDLAEETFSQECLPAHLYKDPYYSTNLNVLKGCLCVSLYYSKSWSCDEFELYARKKNDGGEFFWTKLLSLVHTGFQRYPGNLRILYAGEILGFSEDGDKIYVLYEEYVVFSYDVKEKNMEKIVAVDRHTQKVLSCIESLVRVEKKKKKRNKKKKAILSQ